MRIRRYEDVRVGEKASFRKTVTEADVWAFGAISGDFNPVHMDESFAKGTMFKTRIAHGMLTAALLDSTLTEIMGQGGIHISQEVKFLLPVKISDSVEVMSEVVEKIEAGTDWSSKRPSPTRKARPFWREGRDHDASEQ
jgi:3-hydroxybutyryl-CoA dehydratase